MDVVMPQLGETVAEGKVSAWFKSPGDRVEAGETLFEIETDKVTMEVQALASGILSEVRVRSGEIAPVGAIVAVIGEREKDESGGAVRAQTLSPAKSGVPDFATPSAQHGNTRVGWGGVSARSGLGEESFTVERGMKDPSPNPSPQGEGESRLRTPFQIAPFAETNTPARNYGTSAGPLGLKVTPLARRLIAQNGIDLAGLARAAHAKGLGKIGRADVEAALADGARRQSPLPKARPQGGRESAAVEGHFAFNAIRRRTAERLAEAWRTIPHVTQAVEVDFSAVERARSAHGGDFKARYDVSLSYLPFIARAACLAMRDYPLVNARLDGEGLTLSREVHLGIAVDLSHEGLVVPVVRHADELSLSGLARAIARQAERARAGALSPDDLSGGTYTISNNGAFGTAFTTPIVNPPQVAVLSTDVIRKKAVVIENDAGDAIAIRPVGVLAQSFDHRAFDGAYSAAFLARVKAILESRDWLSDLG